jgi:hypothetical protein
MDPPGSQDARPVDRVDDADNVLLFGRFPASTSANVYESLPVYFIALETTDAVLHHLRDLHEKADLVDQPEIQEAFADIVALLSTFWTRPIVEYLPRESNRSDQPCERHPALGAPRR